MRDGDFSLVANPDYEISTSNMFQERWIPTVRTEGIRIFNYLICQRSRADTKHCLDNPELLKELKAKLLQINKSVMAEGTDWHLQ